MLTKARKRKTTLVLALLVGVAATALLVADTGRRASTLPAPETPPPAPPPPTRRKPVFSRILRTRKRKVVAILAVLALIAVAAAWAFWSAKGTGTASGKNASLVPLTVSKAGPPAKVCQPGQTCNLVVTVTNPVSNGGLSLYEWNTSAPQLGTGFTSLTGSCPAANWTRVDTVVHAFAPTIPIAAGASVEVQLPDAVTLADAAPDGCQGAIFEYEPVNVWARTP